MDENEKLNGLTRRKFLKTAAGAAGATLFGGMGCIEDPGGFVCNDNETTQNVEGLRSNTTMFSPGTIGSLPTLPSCMKLKSPTPS